MTAALAALVGVVFGIGLALGANVSGAALALYGFVLGLLVHLLASAGRRGS